MYGMKVCVVTDGGGRLPECDLALFGFNRLGEVDYESELSGRSDKFEEAGRPGPPRAGGGGWAGGPGWRGGGGG